MTVDLLGPLTSKFAYQKQMIAELKAGAAATAAANKFAGLMKKPPTAEEVEEYCRDPDSSGCDLDMMDMLMKQSKAAPAKKPKFRWNADIDDAVFKCD